ncbi:MAG: cob(I)yrinic acid a,c-diamide adenosyltransferase [Mycoplasma sp.]|nr:cob(I)yrinic acid a,c-diamide adenosyltransferase [Mycoplasma sp.]
MLHIYYGFGRGKTSTLNGTALRAISSKKKVEYFRFLKGRETGENEQLAKLGLEIKNYHFTNKFTKDMTPEEKIKTKEIILKGLKDISESSADIIFLDEFLDLVETKHATTEQLLDAIKDHIKTKDVLISGHYFLKEIFDKADLITHLKAEKHYFNKGVQAKKGIEF